MLLILSQVTLTFHTQLRLRSKIPSYAYVPKIWLRSKRYGYVPSYTAAQLRLIQDTIRFKLRYNQKVPVQSPVKLGWRFHTQLLSRSKIPSYAYIPRYAYVPKNMVTSKRNGYVSIYAATQLLVTFQATQLLSYAYTIQDMFRFQLRCNQKVRFQSRVKLGLRFKICSYAYVSKYILTRTLLNPSRCTPPQEKQYFTVNRAH